MMYYYGSGMGGWATALMLVTNLAFWVLVVLACVGLVRFNRRWRSATSSSELTSPSEILALRFARGEIDEQEYTQRLQALSRATDGPHP